MRHEASRASFGPGRTPGFESRDLGMKAASFGLATAAVVRWRGTGAQSASGMATLATHDAELVFSFVLYGSAALHCEGRGREAVTAGDAFVVPAGRRHALRECSADLELLEVGLPASFATVSHEAGEG